MIDRITPARKNNTTGISHFWAGNSHCIFFGSSSGKGLVKFPESNIRTQKKIAC
jgi:hypothetical protein